MCAGKKDCLKRNKQKRLFQETVKKLHPQFCAETGTRVSYSTLLREKPYWVVQPKNVIEILLRLCIRHENFEYKLNKLNRLGELLHNSKSQCIKTYSCVIIYYDCMLGLCGDYKIKIESWSNEDTVQYFQWQVINEDRNIKGEKKTVKLTKKNNCYKHSKKFENVFSCGYYSNEKHVYGISENLKAKREQKDNLKETELMIQIDFAENCMEKYGKEIQSIRFGASKCQLSIHTIIFMPKSIPLLKLFYNCYIFTSLCVITLTIRLVLYEVTRNYRYRQY